ncbi:MAG: glycosyltransferase family 9 protein [Sodalis sp. (in: enterobacteria)]|uniref:glycosyltransferase family 9 protein n=1 Tax=Sodalis sp. (in: enterobacteria) TaxID=1898979 RepID=UPI003F35C7CD
MLFRFAAGLKPVNLAGRLSLPQLAAVIDGARLFIGVNSAPMHMAAALNTPCVVLFGPTKLQRWRPWSEKVSCCGQGIMLNYRIPIPLILRPGSAT